MFRVDGAAIPAFNSLLELDLSTIEPSMAASSPSPRSGRNDGAQAIV
jgi:aconitase A